MPGSRHEDVFDPVPGQPIQQGGREVIILEKRSPFAEAQVGGEQRSFSPVPLMHESEEQADLCRFGLDVPDFVAQESVIGNIT